MGLTAHVYRNPLGDCTNGGITSKHDGVCIVNVDGPFDPSDDYVAVALTDGPTGNPIFVPLDKNGREMHGGMFGGNYIGGADSRLGEAIMRRFGIEARVALPVHDRFETAAQQRLYST